MTLRKFATESGLDLSYEVLRALVKKNIEELKEKELILQYQAKKLTCTRVLNADGLKEWLKK